MQAPRSQSYRDAAIQCTLAAERCSTRSSAAFFQELAKRWNELAQEQEGFEKALNSRLAAHTLIFDSPPPEALQN